MWRRCTAASTTRSWTSEVQKVVILLPSRAARFLTFYALTFMSPFTTMSLMCIHSVTILHSAFILYIFDYLYIVTYVLEVPCKSRSHHIHFIFHVIIYSKFQGKSKPEMSSLHKIFPWKFKCILTILSLTRCHPLSRLECRVTRVGLTPLVKEMSRCVCGERSPLNFMLAMEQSSGMAERFPWFKSQRLRVSRLTQVW